MTNKLKDVLYKPYPNKRPSFGTWVQTGSPAVVEILASTGRFDWICLDLEHGSFGFSEMVDCLRAMHGYDVTPAVRIPEPDPIWLRRCLDAGAMIIFIPMIKSGIQLRELRRAAFYPPWGSRGIGHCRANQYGRLSVGKENHNITLISQIECTEAMKDLDEILLNSDGTMIGPLDLAGSYGDVATGVVGAALERYVIRSQELDVAPGIHLVDPTETQIYEARKMGYKIIALGTDAVLLRQGAQSLYRLRQIVAMR